MENFGKVKLKLWIVWVLLLIANGARSELDSETSTVSNSSEVDQNDSGKSIVSRLLNTTSFNQSEFNKEAVSNPLNDADFNQSESNSGASAISNILNNANFSQNTTSTDPDNNDRTTVVDSTF